MGGDADGIEYDSKAKKISIHTSVWEVTQVKVSRGKDKAYFNPHLRMGGDLSPFCAISITDCNFNPHLRMGGDGKYPFLLSSSYKFQSTPPYGR